MASIMLLVIVLNYSLGAIIVLVATGVIVKLGTAEGRARVVIGSVPKGFETVDLTSKGAFSQRCPDLLGAGQGWHKV